MRRRADGELDNGRVATAPEEAAPEERLPDELCLKIHRLMVRAREVDQAIVGESARWGDHRRAVPYKREVEWLSEQAWLRDVYWTQNHPRVLQRFRNAGLYPDVAAPTLSRHGGRIAAGFPLALTAPAGSIYYTLDGRDPRLATGSIPLRGRSTCHGSSNGGARTSNARPARFANTRSAI